MIIEEWVMDGQLTNELEKHYKTRFSLSLANYDPIYIGRALTFDGLAQHITVEGLQKFLEALNEKFLGGRMQGVGLEVGSGPGTFVAAFAKMSTVKKMYGVEACKAIVETLMVKVVTSLALEDSSKVVGAIGDFDHIEIQDSSVDFVFDFFSLHHSSNLRATLVELNRVLKVGGVVVCVDKARANTLSDMELNKLLDTEYTSEGKRQQGVPEDVVHTRRMNGEHEYRLKDWERNFTEAGFDAVEHYNIAKIGGVFPVRVCKYIISFFPVKIQSKISWIISRHVTNNLEPSNRIFTNIFPEYPREFSLIIARKTGK